MAAVSPLRLCVSLLLIFCSVLCGLAVEEVVIVHAPESVKFLSSDPVHSSYLSDIFSAMLAYTVPAKINWHSMAVVSPWKRPEAIIVLELQGFGSGVDMQIDGTRFLLENSGDIDEQFDLLSSRTGERFLGKRPVLLHMNLADELHDSKIVQPLLLKSILADPGERLTLAINDPDLGTLIKGSTFNISLASDVRLLTEIATLREFLKTLRTHKSLVRDNIPDVYWLEIGGLEPIVSAYGTDSLQFREAVRLLRQIITEVKNAMRDVYDDKAVVAVMKVNESPELVGFKNRKLLQTAVEELADDAKDLNLAPKWDPTYPVTFTIFVVLGIGLSVAIFGISVAMWHMDPGRDSIIYRATKRMKKD